ncbi:MAG: response regulator transcription factor [Chloroflexi bacterium]|nr:response regulator transcription factor [Chloroflexota bacterium]
MGKSRILLADDHAVVRAGIHKVIEDSPDLQIVAEVEDGSSLLECLERTRPDCLLVDISMPAFDPLKSIPEIRNRYPDLKILVVSAYDDDVYVHGLLEAGVDGYHLKDQSLGDLKLAIHRVLNGERWISGSLIKKLVDQPRPSPQTPMLTSRQIEILRLLQDGLDNNRIALEMNLSVKTIENHLTRVYKQLGVCSRLEASNYVNHHPEVLRIKGHRVFQQRPLTRRSHEVAILLVDDNRRYLHQLKRILSKVVPQADQYEANDSNEAVYIAKNIQPQLVLVDVVLGEEDGIRCARRIKAVSAKSRLVIISAYPDREFHRLSIEAGAVAFLDKKDLDAKTLQQVVEDLL